MPEPALQYRFADFPVPAATFFSLHAGDASLLFSCICTHRVRFTDFYGIPAQKRSQQGGGVQNPTVDLSQTTGGPCAGWVGARC